MPAQALDACCALDVFVLARPASAAILPKLAPSLNYDRIRRKYSLTDEDVEQLLALLQREALLVPGTADVTGAIPADPSDEKILACALDGRADLIVSGNLHLLDLGQYRGVSILNVRQFLARECCT